MPTYIIRAGEEGPVKIGHSSNVQGRLAGLQTANHAALTIIRVIDTPFNSEADFHARFAHRRLHGEWFSFDPEMLTHVPSEPVRHGAKDRVKAARKAAREEMQSLMRGAHRAFFLIESRRAFFERIARELEITRRRAKALYYGEARAIEVHEMVLLKEFVGRLHQEPAPAVEPRAVKPDDLLRDC